MNTEIAQIVNDPAWLVHRYDPGYDAFHLRAASREDRRAATFLLDEYLKSQGPNLVVERGKVVAALPRRSATRHFVLHSAFCCSTLIANGLDIPGTATVLKEPVVLNDLVGWQRRGARADDLRVVAADALAALARPFEARECVVIKPANIVNAIAPMLMEAQAASRAILMYAPMETFLTSVAKKGLDGRLWVRGLFAGLVQDGIADFGYTPEDLIGLTDLQIAALGWLAQHRLFHRLLEGPLADRMRTLRSDVLLREPGDAMVALAQHFRLGLDDGAARAKGQGPAFGRHSKTGTAFDVGLRDAEYRMASERHAEELREVATWARRVAHGNGIALDLAMPLVG